MDESRATGRSGRQYSRTHRRIRLLCAWNDNMGGNYQCPTRRRHMPSHIPCDLQIYAGHVPFEHLSRDHSIMGAILQGSRPSRPSGSSLRAAQLYDMEWACIQECWIEDVSRRPSLKKVLTSFSDVAPIWHIWERGVAVNSVAFRSHSDHTQAALGLSNKTIRICHIPTGTIVQTLFGHTYAVRCVAYAPDGSMLASASHDKTIKLWNTISWRCIYTLTGHNDVILLVCWSPDGYHLASASRDGAVHLWFVHSGHSVRILYGHSDIIWSLAYSHDGAFIASGSADMTVRVWDAHTGQQLRTLTGHRNAVVSVAFLSRTGTLVSICHDVTVRTWDVESGAVLREQEGVGDVGREQRTSLENSLQCAAHSPNGARMALGFSTKRISILNSATGQLAETVSSTVGQVWDLIYSPDGKCLGVGGRDGCQFFEIKVRNPRSILCDAVPDSRDGSRIGRHIDIAASRNT